MYWKPIEQIETKRLRLRKLELEDIPLYFERLSSSKEIPKYMLWNTHKEIEETIKYVTDSVKRYEEGHCYKWVIALKETNELIGIIELLRFKEEEQSCSFAYMLAKAYWNKGYMTEALDAVLDFAFTKLEVKVIEADHFSENIASGKVMQKVGMRYKSTQKEKYEKNGKLYTTRLYEITQKEYSYIKEENKLKTICNKQAGIIYKKRCSTYAIIEVEDKIAIVSAGGDYYLYGGGIEENEDEIEALRREMIEEAGYTLKKVKWFDRVKSYEYNETHGNLEIVATIYTAKLDKKVAEKVEEDHEMLWIEPSGCITRMYYKFQSYEIEKYLKDKENK